MRDVYIAGVGMTTFGKHPERSAESLGWEAVRGAVKDSGFDRDRIGFAACGHVRQGPGIGQRTLRDLGMTGVPVVNVENACASGSTAFHLAWQTIATGQADVALAFGVEKLTDISGPLPLDQSLVMPSMGLVLPGQYALIARAHMEAHGVTPEHFAKISVKNHDHSTGNPYAQYQKTFTVEEVLESRVIADPVTLLMCCPTTDGGAAAVLCSDEVLGEDGAPHVRIRGSALRSGTLVGADTDLSEPTSLTARPARAAYEMAGVEPSDVDVVEVHDATAVGELTHYEALGLCEVGEAQRLVDEGETALGGRHPVNPSGGLLSRGHPLGATGVAQVCELTWQLRGEAHGRQVEDARIGLVHCMGGGPNGLDGDACVVAVLERM